MKYLLIILTISCILAKDVYQLSWDIWFSIHQKEITEKLCENKENPLMNCNGHCYLSKQLKKAVIELEQDLEDTSSNRPKVSNDVKVLDFKTLDYTVESVDFTLLEKGLVIHSTTHWNYLKGSDIEHPPSVV